jgi:hypothetical protein
MGLLSRRLSKNQVRSAHRVLELGLGVAANSG